MRDSILLLIRLDDILYNTRTSVQYHLLLEHKNIHDLLLEYLFLHLIKDLNTLH